MSDDATPRKGARSSGGGEAAAARGAARPPVSAPPVTDDDLYLFNEGTHYHLYNKLGCHLTTLDGTAGATFAVWAPNTNYVSVIGDFNGWDRSTHRLAPRGSSGVWEGFIAGVKKGDAYKYHIGSGRGGQGVEKADPFGIHHETPPKTGSKVWDLEYDWGDA